MDVSAGQTEPLTFNGLGSAYAQSVTYDVQFAGELDSNSANTSVAAVDPASESAVHYAGAGTKYATFTITPTGPGTTTVTITDKHGKTATINVTVSPFTEYLIPTSNSGAGGIVTGSDGNLWFNEGGSYLLGNYGAINKIGKVTTSGLFTEYPVPPSGAVPRNIAEGPDGNVWFTEYPGQNVANITTSGTITQYPIQGSPGDGITAGPGGNVWFSQYNDISEITTGGAVTQYPIPPVNAEGLTVGPDGNLWFLETATNRIAKITSGGALTEYPNPSSSLHVSSGGQSIAAGPDGNVWFTESDANGDGTIVRTTTGGSFTQYAIPGGGYPGGIVSGPDGNLWFTDANYVGRITPQGAITLFAAPPGAAPGGICVGPDHNIWFTDIANNAIGWLAITP